MPISSSVITDNPLGHDVLQMVIHAGYMVKFVLFVLLAFSIISWAIVFFKFILFRKAERETKKFVDLFWDEMDLNKTYDEWKTCSASPVAHMFASGYKEFLRMWNIKALSKGKDASMGRAEETLLSQQIIMENLVRSLKKTSIDQIKHLERGISFLATTGNTAPFIGLFGTVWGIMEAFRGIGIKGSANLAVVAPGISEALIATAAGLAVAIPAVMAFNHFNYKLLTLKAEMDIFTSDFLSTIERQSFKKYSQKKAKP